MIPDFDIHILTSGGRHLSNIHDPSDPMAEMYHVTDYHTHMNGPEAVHEDWLRHLEWIDSNVIDRPQSTPYYTTEQLEDNGMVGLYEPTVVELVWVVIYQ